MKILHLTTHDYGGAAISAIRLHKSLLRHGVDSKVLSISNTSHEIDNHLLFNGRIINRNINYPILTFRNLLIEKIFRKYEKESNHITKFHQDKYKYSTPVYENGNSNFTLFSYPDSIYDITTSPEYKEADIIHLHWVANFLDYETFFAKNDKPIVWTLHDENPYLGGFHYQDDVINNVKTHGVKEQEFVALKAKCIQGTDKISVISPSDWIAKTAKESSVFKDKRVNVIRYSIDKAIFKARDKGYSRDLFQLPHHKKIILVASQDLSVPRKGVRFVEALLKDRTFDDFLFVFAGSNSTLKNSNVITLGTIQDELLMSCLYSAADYFLLPSLLDNLPNTLLESLHCGTPVVAFNIGDFEAIFKNNALGILVEAGNIEALKFAFTEILEDKYTFDTDKIVSKALELFPEEKAVNAYVKEYELLLQ